MNITSRQLKAFLLTARYGSFSRAAERLYITQSGMSVLVRELEAQLGFRLFDRTTRKVTLTEFGSRLLPIADRSLLELEAAATNIGRSASAAKGSVVVGAAPFPAARLLPKAIAAYSAREPQVQVRLVDAAGTRLVDMVRYGEVDVAVSGVRHEAPRVECSSLARFKLVLVHAADAAADLPREVRWSDVAERKLVGFSRDTSIQQRVDEQLARVGRHAPPDLVCNYLETQIAMVEAGAGMAVIPAFAASACAARKVVLRPIVDPVVTSDLYSIASWARKPARVAHGFTVFLKSYFAEMAGQWPAQREALEVEAVA